MKLFDDIKKAFNIIKEFERQRKKDLAILDKQIKDLNELNYIINKYKPKTNTMLTKKKLKEEIDELKEEARALRLFVGELNDRVKLLEDPPKYKVGQVVGKYTITEYLGKRFL